MDPRYISQPFSRAALHGPAALIGLACDSVPGLTYDESVAAHESAIGRPVDVIHNYHLWETIFPNVDEARRTAAGQVILYTWQTRRYSGISPTWASIAAGAEDATIDAAAGRIRAMTGPVMVNFQNEPESSVGTLGTTLAYRAAARRIVERFRAAGADNAIFVYVVMGVADSPRFTDMVRQMYPGDDVTDWIGFDPFNWASARGVPWRGFEETVRPWYDWATTVLTTGNKPLLLAEYGTVEDPARPERKAAWFAEVEAAVSARTFPLLRLLCYFDHRPPASSGHWKLDSSPSSLAAYGVMARAAGRSEEVHPGSTTSSGAR